MKKRSLKQGLLWGVMTALVGAVLPVHADEPVVISGTGSALPSMIKIGASFKKRYPAAKLRFITPPMGSGGSIKALAHHKLDLAFSARPPKEKELNMRKMEWFEYARTPFHFATRPDGAQPGDGFTLDEYAAIYRGELKRWPDGRTLRLISRPEKDSDTKVLRSMSKEMETAVNRSLRRKGRVIAITDYDSAEMIANTPSAIGTVTAALVKGKGLDLLPLAIDRLLPTVEALKKGDYPFYKTFHVVTGEDPDPATERFIRYLKSDEARTLLESDGHWVTLEQ